MILYICRQGHRRTITPFLKAAKKELQGRIRVVSYEELFLSRSVPLAHLIFTDIDRLTVYEVETAQAIADAVATADVSATIVNNPADVLCRYALLTKLYRAEINSFQAKRLDGDPIDLSYPIFLRREDEALGPETDLLTTNDDMADAHKAMREAGRPLRGRLAVEYRAERSKDGYFRKYSAFLVNDQILPQHIQTADHWAVKKDTRKTDPQAASDELAFVRNNPHREVLQKAFAMANIQFGRIDYGLVNGRVEIYEINTNPTFPGSDKPDLRQERRILVRQRLVDAFIGLDRPINARGRIRFRLPRPRVHRLAGPRNPLSRWMLVRRWVSPRTAKITKGQVPPKAPERA